MNETESDVNNDYQSIFVSVGAFYPHHVGYEIHSLPEDILDKNGAGRAVQGSHTLNLEGMIRQHDSEKESQACNITITDISTSEVNYAPQDNHAYMGSLRLGKSERMTAIIHLKPSIVRDVLSLFNNRPADADYQFKRAVIVRIDIPLAPYGEGDNERYKILRVGFE